MKHALLLFAIVTVGWCQRIPPLEEKDWTNVERQLLAPVQTERGVLNLYRTLVRYPKLFPLRLAFGRYIQRESSLPARDREILICRTAWLWNAEYEWAEHSRIALDNGLTRDEVRRVGAAASGWSPFDAALIAVADQLHRETFVQDSTWNTLAARYDTHQLMEAVMTVGGYAMLGAALNSFGVRVETGSTGFPAERMKVERPVAKGGIPIRLARPRIGPAVVSEWTPEERELLTPVKQERGYVLNVYATLARDPKMYRPWIGLARHLLRDSSLPGREREMLICRTAWLTSGEYEWSAHIRYAKDNGLTDAEIARLARGPSAAGWSAAEAVLLRAVDELHYDAFISDPTWKALAARFDTHQLMDLVFTVGSYKMLAMALNSFGTPLDQGMAGFPK